MGRIFSHRAYRVHGVSCALFRVHKEVVHLLLMLIFNLLRPPPWVLFSVQIHSEELKALEGVGAGLLGNSGKLHLYGVVALFGVEALRNHC